ncbi:hypothetical protein Tco_0180775 [Tanacetum coccineum]
MMLLTKILLALLLHAVGVKIYPYIPASTGSRSSLFAATDPQIPKYCELLKTNKWLMSTFISQDCRPTNPSEEAHNLETSYIVWEKTMQMIGLPSDAVEKLFEGEDISCKFEVQQHHYC